MVVGCMHDCAGESVQLCQCWNMWCTDYRAAACLCRQRDARARRRKALLRKQVMAADSNGLWTLQTSVFPENRASISLYHSAGFCTIGIREKIGQLDGI